MSLRGAERHRAACCHLYTALRDRCRNTAPGSSALISEKGAEKLEKVQKPAVKVISTAGNNAWQ